MNGLFEKIRKRIYDVKQHIHRAQTYVSLANAGMILFIFLETMGFNSKQSFIPIFILSLAVLLVIGFVDIKILKGYQEEQKLWFSRNPQLVEMKEKVNNIETMLNEIKNKNGRKYNKLSKRVIPDYVS